MTGDDVDRISGPPDHPAMADLRKLIDTGGSVHALQGCANLQNLIPAEWFENAPSIQQRAALLSRFMTRVVERETEGELSQTQRDDFLAANEMVVRSNAPDGKTARTELAGQRARCSAKTIERRTERILATLLHSLLEAVEDPDKRDEYARILRLTPAPVASGTLSRGGTDAHEDTPAQALSLQQVAEQVLSGSENLPFQRIYPKSDLAMDWRALLDGGTLTTQHAATQDAVIERRIMLGGQEMDFAAARAWLTNERGRTVFLHGDRGDGKSSYINLLAARSLDTHVFLRRYEDSPFSIRDLENYRTRLESMRGAMGDTTPTIVVVCSLPLYGDSDTEQRLIDGLRANQGDGHGLVILVEGRPAELSRVCNAVGGDEVSLAPVNRAEARALAQLIETARARILGSGLMDEPVLSHQYPNLDRFLASSENERISTLTHDSPALLIGLLRAVYGNDMWQMLMQEFDDLTPADQKAYLHVCLASMVGRSLPHHMLERLTSGADLPARCDRDPWCYDDGHLARHPLIAQVVLEKAVSRPGGKLLLDECTGDYLLHARQPHYLAMLSNILRSLSSIEPVASAGACNRLKSLIRQYTAKHIAQAVRFPSAVVGQSNYDHRALLRWAGILSDFVPESSRDESHTVFLDMAVELLETAKKWLTPAKQGRTVYYLTKCRLAKHRLALDKGEKLDIETLYESVHDISGLIGSDWCRGDFYTDLFRWSRDALKQLREQDFPDESQVDFLYQMLSQGYERLRAEHPGRVDEHVVKAYSPLIFRWIGILLPPDRATQLVGEAWQLSLNLGTPNAATGALYGELLISSATNPDSGTVSAAMSALRKSLDTNPLRPKGVYLMAYCRERFGIEADDLADRLDRAASADPTHINQGFLDHVRGILHSGTDERVALLRSALDNYSAAFRDPGDNYPNWVFEIIGHAWDHACRQLQSAGVKDSVKYRREYDTVRQNNLRIGPSSLWLRAPGA